MTVGAVVFMALSWSFVLGLLVWTYSRILRKPTIGEGDGPASPATGDPAPGRGGAA